MATKSTAERQQDSHATAKVLRQDPSLFIALVPMHPYDVIGSVSNGDGELATALARYAYEGRVYAIDSSQKELDATINRAKNFRLGNVEPVLAKETSIPIEDGKLDGLVAAAVLTTSRKPKEVVKEFHRLLRKGGWLAVINDEQPADENRARSIADLSEMAIQAGFRRVTSRPFYGRRHLDVFKK